VAKVRWSRPSTRAGEPVVGSAGLIAAIRDLEPGTEVEVTLIRDGAEQTVTATLTSRPED
jgi:S1-C subfamily serine protease